MKRLIAAASAMAIVSIASPAISQSVFNFSQNGWSNNGVLLGSFTADDLNNDGQISSFQDEVLNFTATYSSDTLGTVTFDSFEGPGEIIFIDDVPVNVGLGLGGLVFTLDGSGQLGDDDFGFGEGIGVFGEGLFLAVGPGPFNLCDGSTVCSGIFDQNLLGGGLPVATAVASMEEVLPPREMIPGDRGSFLDEVPALATNINAVTVTGDDLGDPEGLFESTPVLPDGTNENGGFVFNLEDIRNLPSRIFFIDPEIATGYVYEVTGDTFFSVQAPSFGAVPDGEYLLTYGMGLTEILLAGEIFEFGPGGVTSFTITGIDPALMLDPENGLAFVTGVSLVNGSSSGQITQTPITENINAVPLPAGGVLLLSGLFGLALVRRRRNSHAG